MWKINEMMHFLVHLKQIMIVTACSFFVSILTYYTFYRLIVQQNGKFEDFALMHAQFQMFHFTSILNVVYSASRVVNEVSHYSIVDQSNVDESE